MVVAVLLCDGFCACVTPPPKRHFELPQHLAHGETYKRFTLLLLLSEGSLSVGRLPLGGAPPSAVASSVEVVSSVSSRPSLFPYGDCGEVSEACTASTRSRSPAIFWWKSGPRESGQ